MTMFYVNDIQFFDAPGSCGTCAFFMKGGNSMTPDAKGWCPMFNESHNSFIYPPQRCKKLFNKALKFPEGTRLVIVKQTNDL